MKPSFFEKSRILVVCKYFGAWGQPWLWRQTCRLTNFDVHILCWEQHNKDVYNPGAIPVSVLDFRDSLYDGPFRWLYRLRNAYGGNYYTAMGAERRYLKRFLRERKPRLILCHDCQAGLRLVAVAKESGIPVVVYTHGLLYTFGNRWLRWSFQNLLPEFAAFIVVSTHQRDWLVQRRVPPEKIHVIPCGVPTDLFKPKPHNAGSLVRFVTASRLVPEKGIQYIISAFSDLCADLPTAQLHVFGDGPWRSHLEGLVAQKGLHQKVIFQGFVETRELAGRLCEYDVFLEHSTIPEGFGISVCEAMASGLPVVVTPVGGILDQVAEGETGLFVRIADIAGLKDSMLRLAKHPELREKMGRAGRQRVVESFGFEKMTCRLEQVLLGLIQETQNRPLSTKRDR